MRVRVCRYVRTWSASSFHLSITRRTKTLTAFFLVSLAAVMPAAAQHTLPGYVEAENYDSGGNGSGYYDTTGGNSGGAYRAGDVDIEWCAEGTYDIGWTKAGEWLNYTVSVGAAGSYNLELRVSSTRGGTIRVEFNGVDKTGSISIPVTGDWQSWATVRKTVTLAAGTQVMRVVFETGSTNLNAIGVWAGGGGGGGGSASAAPYGGSRWGLPGKVEAENYDTGGQGVGYYDATGGNSGGLYRSGDVDIAPTPSGGYTVGWTDAGEWLRYSVDVSAGNTYRLVARVASAGRGGTFHVEFGGVDKTGPMWIPDTGGWQTYQDVAVTVSLSAGAQSMAIVFDSVGDTGAVGNISYVSVESAASIVVNPPQGGGGGGKLRVLSWNLAFSERGGVWAQAVEIAGSGANVALLQEASKWNEDISVTMPQYLTALTGVQWTSQWASHSGRYSPNEGTLIVTRLPVISQGSRTAYDRGFARMAVSVGGVAVNLFSAHLDWYDTGMRSAQLDYVMSYARDMGGPRIVGGDWNSWWGEWWVLHMLSEYTDTWTSLTGSNENGYTLNGAVRFDYLFESLEQSSRITPTSMWVQDTSLSDHAAVVAEYTVR